MMNDLKMLTQDEVAMLINVNRDTVAMLREIGVIQSIKTGKCYMFSQAEIRRFQSDYRGMDISNRQKAMECYSLVNAPEMHR
jgi:excisionase family DNA binding protein